MHRIAVDARPLNQKFNGIGEYLFQVLDHLLTEDTPSAPHWLLYSDQPISLPSHWQRVSNRSGISSNRVMGAVRAQLQFGRWAVEDEATLYWSPRHQLPFGLPRTLPTVVARAINNHNIAVCERRACSAIPPVRTQKPPNHPKQHTYPPDHRSTSAFPPVRYFLRHHGATKKSRQANTRYCEAKLHPETGY